MNKEGLPYRSVLITVFQACKNQESITLLHIHFNS